MKEEDTCNLISALLNYIDLMEEELSELVPMAHLRGWKSSRIEKGNEARENINNASGELFVSIGISEPEIALALQLSTRLTKKQTQ